MRDKKKYGWLSGLMSNVLGGTREYNFNNVTYIVEPRFQSADSEDAKMPQEKFARIIEKSAAHLQDSLDSDKIQAEYDVGGTDRVNLGKCLECDKRK
jgi:hypothetical protein